MGQSESRCQSPGRLTTSLGLCQELAVRQGHVAQGNPEQPVQRIQPRTWPFPLEKDELLPQRQDIQGGVIPTAEEHSGSGQESEDELEDES